MNFNFTLSSPVSKSFRSQSILSNFDIQTQVISKQISGSLNLEEKPWNIGVIVGASGTGKSSIGKACFKEELIKEFNWSSSSLVDDFNSKCSLEEIIDCLNSVGFSSPPSWIKPYSVLSEGEKMRANLARAISDQDKKLFVFDEFTSVVDRTVACVGSHAIQKAIRKRNRQFVAISCHRDILEWLQPDWVFDTDRMEFFFTQKQGDLKSNFKSLNATGLYGNYLKSITI